MKYSLAFLSMLLVASLLWLPQAAHADAIPEYEMKAAYLYNFANLTTWPMGSNNLGSSDSEPNNSVKICVLGNDSFGGALEKMTRNSGSGIRITLLYLANLNEVNNCQILFIEASELNNAKKIMGQLEKLPVLTVTDNPDLFRAGAMIGMFLDNKRLAFDVNYARAKNAQLSISSKLLRVARKVLQ